VFDPAAASSIAGVRVRLDPHRLDGAIDVLDRIEGEGELYRRVVIATTAGEAFSYEWIRSTANVPLLLNGWLNR
jgi:gamma-glutamylcyclotransferase (GGCT)/AIG2-like uncharacterized protein YtfP